ncbi:MAG: hypothetical protein D6791_05890, partial [Chloroflexi bacterium]
MPTRKPFSHLCQFLPVLVILFLIVVSPALAQEPALAEKTRILAHIAREGVEAAVENDAAKMQVEYEELHEAWEVFEDQVRETDPEAYVELEGALSAVKAALQARPLDAAAVQQAYEHLVVEANEVAEKFEGGEVAHVEVSQVTPADLVKRLDAAYH